ncbi:MAG TPA: hypothetical protein VG738_17975 [Chitinophagaceae bacterium]|nr:hypothetical protein [Chitinophagaceae bacterium]
MQFDEFIKSTESNTPPGGMPVYIIALWYDAKGDWHKAHKSIDSENDKNSAWVHAYLHRKEGDIWNADYWYSRAGKKRPATSLEEEWENITRALL